MRHSVLGFTSIMQTSAYQRMSRMHIERAFGVPARFFRDHDSVLLRLSEWVFEPRDLTFDRTGIEAVLPRLTVELE
jgi:hypothetical protein